MQITVINEGEHETATNTTGLKPHRKPKMMYTTTLLVLLLSISGLNASVQLQILSKLYLPYTYTPTAQYLPSKDAAEQMAYDAKTKLLYSVGHTNMHVINISDVTNMQVLFHSTEDNVDVTDVEVCGDYVFVANDNQTKREDGYVDVFRTYNPTTKTVEHLHRIIVGDLPDMIHPTSDCSKLVIALEAEPYDNEATQSLTDNPGAVIIVTFSNTPAGPYTIKTLDFTQFDSQLPVLEKTGVRHVYKDNNNLFSNDVEPEYIAFNEEETTAYISLQENNALAVVDLQTETIEGVYGLGYKDWSDKAVDISDKDQGINLRPWKVHGMYQPDSLKVYRHHGKDYVITANEGDSKDYKYFSEIARVADKGLSEIYESNATITSGLELNNALGRLQVTTTQGYNATSQKFDSLYTFGGRSFSIWRADTMELVYDSGSEISQKISLLLPHLFNNDLKGKDRLSEAMDSRSDNKGPETESIAVGHFADLTLLFIGNERPGVVAVYSIDGRLSEVKPKFETLLSDIPNSSDKTWMDLYNEKKISMVDCEDMRFIPAADSPNGKPLLLVSGSVSGTITIIQVDVSPVGFGLFNNFEPKV